MEKYLVKATKEYLTLLQKQGKLYYIRNNTGAIPINGRFVRFGNKGSSDYIIFFKDGQTVFCECKSKSKSAKLSPAQEDFKNTIRALGYKFYVVRDMAEVESLVKENI